jgi:hypothetical protein
VAHAVGIRSRAERLRRVALGALLALAALTMAIEFVLRLRGIDLGPDSRPEWESLVEAGILGPSNSALRPYALVPGSERVVDGRGMRISAQGTRGPDVSSPKPASERRLLVLGGELAFGSAWADEGTLAAELERVLNARELELQRGVTWRALGLGTPGYTLRHSWATLRDEGDALEPDLVLLCLSLATDLGPHGYLLARSHGRLVRDFLPLPHALKQTLWRWSHLYAWIAAWHARAAEEGPEAWLEPRVPWAGVRADNQDHARTRLAEARAWCRARGLALLLAAQDPPASAGGDTLGSWLSRAAAELQLDVLRLPAETNGATSNAPLAQRILAHLVTESLLP